MSLSASLLEGWILDVYPKADGMHLWIIDEQGRSFSATDPWIPSFYLEARSPSFQNHIQQLLRSFRVPFSLDVVERKDFFSHQTKTVIQVSVHNPLYFERVVARLVRFAFEVNQNGRQITLYNADMNLSQVYFYERDLFPLARVFLELGKNREVRSYSLCDSRWDLEYAMPPLRYAHLGFDTSAEMDPNHAPGGARGRGRRGAYLFTLGPQLGKGTSYLLNESEEEFVRSLNRHMAEWDPDVLLTDWGDSYIMPRLKGHSDRTGIPICLSRDPSRQMAAAREHSFFSFGKMYYRAGPRTLFGRLHVDTQNSFMVGHSGLDGLIEIARVAKIPLQRAARCTIGTSLSSMQHEWAVRQGYLIPMDKGQTEEFRPGDEFIASDRGGLVYEPDIGWHEDLVEYDFISMYPEIMIRNNITPEAVNCACCPDNRVPEIQHHLCRRQKGMVPAVLGPIVKKRRLYKKLIQQGHPRRAVYKARTEAFKWALVTCFGYLGFRNARFGRIEAHECVNAYSREALLCAKETAEAHGFQFVHAIVDSLWLKKPRCTDEEIEQLRQAIEVKTGLPIGFEGKYDWIRFCASKMNPLVGVPNRYFGLFRNGELKVRGIELRRHDTPEFISQLQQDLLAAMGKVKTVQEVQALEPVLENIIQGYRDRLRTGHLSPMELALKLNLSQEPSEYVNDTLSALAAKKIAASGVPLHPGEGIQFIVTSEKDVVKDWRVTPLAFIDDYFEYDVNYYDKLIDRASEITPFYPKPPQKKSLPNKSKQLYFPGFAPA